MTSKLEGAYRPCARIGADQPEPGAPGMEGGRTLPTRIDTTILGAINAATRRRSVGGARSTTHRSGTRAA